MTEAKQDAITAWLNKLVDGVNNRNSMALQVAEKLYDTNTRKPAVSQESAQ